MEPEHEQGLGLKTGLVFCVTLLLAAAFQSASLQTLAYDLPPGYASETVVPMAETWHGWMERLGPAGVTQSVQDWITELHDESSVVE